MKDLLLNAHYYLVKISTVDDREIFKICLEYWTKVSSGRWTLEGSCNGSTDSRRHLQLVSDLYEETQLAPIMSDMNPLMALNLGGVSTGMGLGTAQGNASKLRKGVYSDILSQLRLVMISRMVKPEEVSHSSLSIGY
jgi:exportin-1